MVEYSVKMTWTNFDGRIDTYEKIGALKCQDPLVDWDRLNQEKPYSMEPISLVSDRPFIGRETDLRELMRTVISDSMGSAYIFGQKRVGKTSIGHELASRAEEELKVNFYPIYIEGGEYVEATASSTVTQLGRKLVREICKKSPAFVNLNRPDFAEGLTPLIEFFEDVFEVQPNARFLIILDEFDELPLDLYKRGPVGDSFFLKLRAISSKPRIGLVLIGGEKLPLVVLAQGEQLNKFKPLSVDYFTKEEHWADFEDLVRRPVHNAIEFSDLAVSQIYEWSAGNPFFTNMVCNNILNDCFDRRDSYVTEYEVDACARRTYLRAELNSFSHFWEDGILDTGLKTEDQSILRRKVFLAMASVLRRGQPLAINSISAEASLQGLDSATVEHYLRQAIQRKILYEEEEGVLKCRVKLFERFLAERGSALLSTGFTDAEERRQLEALEKQNYVKAEEICELVSSWGVYNPSPLSDERFRAWLDQFESNHDKRLMYKLAKSIRFYGEKMVREKHTIAMNEIKKMSVEKRKATEKVRHDLLVTFPGSAGKSGAQFARVFCQSNKIFAEHIKSMHEVSQILNSGGDQFSAVVAVDDFLGSGETAETQLEEINNMIGDAIRAKAIPFFLVYIAGFSSAIDRVNKKAESLNFPLELIAVDLLNEHDRAFNENSNIFPDSSERVQAKEIALSKGKMLEKRYPLGYRDCEAMVVFFTNCPNSTLPIFYKQTEEWTALFPRQ